MTKMTEALTSLESSLEMLRQYSCLDPKVPASESEKASLRQAILQVCQVSEAENIGVCADSLSAGLTALAAYLTALGYEATLETPRQPEAQSPVYLKFNTQKSMQYSDTYHGDYRGVLIACQSEQGEVDGTYGYFPLDLFDQ